VNTIRFEGRTADNEWRPLREFNQGVPAEMRTQGFNTDADALVSSLREDLGMELRGKKVLLLGLGGAGRTAALKLASEQVQELFLVNRTSAKIREVEQEINRKFPDVRVGEGYPKADVDVVINATSLGLGAGDAMPLDEKQFSLKQARAVYDMIYRPAETDLLAAARQAGCKTANGLGMLLHQGARAFEIWTGQAAPLAVMRRTLEQNIYGH